VLPSCGPDGSRRGAPTSPFFPFIRLDWPYGIITAHHALLAQPCAVWHNTCIAARSVTTINVPVPEIIAILALAAIAALWLDSIKVREAAVHAAHAACAAEGFQLLDDTVAIASLKPARDTDGRLALQRAYEFEYSDTGDNRLKGSVVLIGRRVLILNVGPVAPPGERVLH
jgi:hypothetical protein